MKINFKNILCRPSLKSEELISIDISADLADAIYQGTTSIEDYQLAVAIFNSDGEVELTEPQIQSVVKYISSFPVWVQIAIVDACENALRGDTKPAEGENVDAEMVFDEPGELPEHKPGEAAPDGGVWAGDNGEPAPPIAMEPLIPKVPETVDDKPNKKKVVRKKSK